MPDYARWLIAGAALIVAFPLAVWLGISVGRRTARAMPGMAMTLWIISAFLKVDPPPPPKAERVHKDEEDAGAPLDPRR